MTDFFDRLDDELRQAAARQDAAASRAGNRRRTRFSRRTRALLATAAALVVAVPAGAAVVDAFRPHREADGVVRTAPRDVIARGADPIFGRWEAFVSATSSGPCFGIRLLDPPGIEPGSTVEGCGTDDRPARIGGGDGPPRTALFGFAPRGASSVRIEARGREGREFPTHPQPSGGRPFFFASLPADPADLPGLRIVALAPDGQLLTDDG
jgi:hypothetical protein